MNSKIYFVFFLFAGILSAQQQAPPVPETWETDVWFDNDWMHISTVDYTFNSECLPIYVLLQTLDFSTNMFVNSAQLNISYNANSQITTSTNELWNTDLQIWENGQRSDFSYTGNNLTLVEIYIWENNDWQINETIQNTYNSNDLLIEALYQERNVNSSILVNREKNDYTYTTFPQIDTIVNSTWDDTNSIWITNSRVTFVYDSSNLVDSKISEDWENNQWINNDIEEFTYDGNDFLIESLSSDWSTTISTYEQTDREFYTNNSQGYPVEVIDQTYFFGNWLNTTRDRRIYPNCATLNVNDDLAEEFSIYPNPVLNQLTIKTPSEFNGTIEIIDINGKRVYNQNWSSNLITIDVSMLNSGVYILKILDDNTLIIKRIIKQ
ncbi:T9SS type A sorting domain-containing protein [Psychroserpens luteus]|uniref:T9SS type A sorting domain-containing protein n=1 Tax=Psychroserpens luteus TaxID=1434066 RepID=A0ABW5ZPG3_9FLAO|nr:T9SS type A sorting domain-containing protein [Psychroserpens luteus]